MYPEARRGASEASDLTAAASSSALRSALPRRTACRSRQIESFAEKEIHFLLISPSLPPRRDQATRTKKGGDMKGRRRPARGEATEQAAGGEDVAVAIARLRRGG